MPLPIVGVGILIGTATGVYGGKKILDAKNTSNKIKSINDNIKQRSEFSKIKLDRYKERMKNSVEELGRLKIRLLSTNLKRFVEDFSKIKEINLKESPGIREIKSLYGTDIEFQDFEKSGYQMTDLAKQSLSGLGSGALMAYGAYGVAGTIGTASTGTAISVLSGAAASNATLAWLGGGSLAAGGLGIAGGTVVLGGLVFGPALAVGGSLMASKARKELNEIYISESKAEAFCSQVESICTVIDGVIKRVEQFKRLLSRLNSYLDRYSFDMRSIIRRKGTDWNNFTDKEKMKISQCMLIAKLMKTIIDTRLLTDDGKLENDSMRILNNASLKISKIQRM